jgi:4-oxalocrotonate tautomerase
MPIVTLKIFPRDVNTKRQLAEGITKVVAEITKNKPESVHVIIEEIPKENWSRGGELAIDRK